MADPRTTCNILAIAGVVMVALQCGHSGVSAAAANKAKLSPIVLIPGIMGSQLEARLSSAPWPLCNTDGRYKSLWFSPGIAFLQALGINCMEFGLKLNYDAAKNTYTPNSGATVRVVGAAGSDVKKVEFLDNYRLVPYFHDMVDYFVARGYQRDVSIRAAPYDWRFAADKLRAKGYYNELKTLVENMYVANANTKVTLVAHSMGGPVSLYFLNNIVSQTWKDTYIHAYVPVAAAWDGGVAALEILISGVSEGVEFLIQSDLWESLRDTTRSFQSVHWLLPSASVFGSSRVFVTVGSDRYTANDFEALFRRIGFPDGYSMYSKVAPLVDGWMAPNVPTYCYYGLVGASSTPVGFTYAESGFPNSTPIRRTMGNGDKTVNQEISEICHKWAREQSATFERRDFRATHIGILSDDDLLAAIKEVVTIQESATAEPTSESFFQSWWWG